MRRVCLYMGFVNDIRRKNVAVEGWLLILGKRVSSYFLQYETICASLHWHNRSWSQQLRIATWTPKAICLTFGKRVLSYVLTRCQWFRTFDPLDNNLFWPSHPSLGGYVFFSTLLTVYWFAKCLVDRRLLCFCDAKRCFQKGVLAGAGMHLCLCNMLL